MSFGLEITIMSRKGSSAALALLVALTVAGPAEAATWTYWSGSYYYYPSYSYYPAYSYYPTYYYAVPAVRYYYTPAPVYLEPATCAAPAPLPVPAAGPSFAQPTPAPPSQTKEPPPGKKDLPPPKVTESRSFSIGVDKAGTTTEVVAKATCRVGFWNISGRDVALNINGQTHVVPANRNVTVMLNREFSWHVEGQQAQQERLPDDKTAHEIVIR